ncbi:N-alpha-acetyltransferase 25, NatB auxiliary subunit [Parasteatoda tepidariorum]|nr:N-alpha-acetyltransferase 25, NatB auxiliary subunit [Parasteatoda tepidariorum]
MAARSHVDTAVNERRLRPIYDCLDNGNNKKALQEADKLLKKQRDFLCAKALKALALVRLGRNEESFNVVQEVHAEDPTDDPTLQAMTICYRELHKLELIADAYERATKKDPQNEELLSHLFMSHVRNGDYKKQQQTAMALYKLKPKNPYYFWAVMSIVMQAEKAEETSTKTMLLSLAERMTEKFVKENKLEAEAEVQLYLMILERQEKYEKAIEVLSSPLKEKMSSEKDLPEREAQYLIYLLKWPEANKAYKKLILKTPDAWKLYEEYFKCIQNLVDMNWQPELNSNDTPEECVDYTFEMAIDFVGALVEEQNGEKEGRKLRGPYYAMLNLFDKLLKKEDPLAQKIGSPVDLLVNFFEQVGTKPTCPVDMSFMMSAYGLKEEEIRKVLEKIEASVSNDSSENPSFPKDLKQMYRHLCYTQLCDHFGIKENDKQQDLLTYTCQLIERYYHALKLTPNLWTTEFQPADNYALVAAHTIINIWEKFGEERFIAQALVLLEQSLKNSPSNYLVKILLCKLYNSIGAADVTNSLLYDSMEIKYIQQDTLGYIVTDSILSAGLFTSANTLLGNNLRFYTSNYKDVSDYLLSCYKFGTFTKIPEFIKFREKMNNSLHYALVIAEKKILDLLLETKNLQDLERVVSAMDVDPEKDHRPTKELVDTRDISIYNLNTLRERKILEEQTEKSHQERMWWLNIRNFTLQIVAAAYYLNKPNIVNNNIENNISNGVKHHMADTLNKLICSLKSSVDSVNKDDLLTSVFPVSCLGPSRIMKYLNGPHIDIFLSSAKLVHYIHSLTEGYSTDTSESVKDLSIINEIRNNYQMLFERIRDVSPDKDSLNPTQVKVFFEDTANAVETLSLSLLLVSVCFALLKPARNSLMRKGKKRKDNVPQITLETFQHVTDLINDMEDFGNNLHDLLNSQSSSDLASHLGIMSDSSKCIKGREDVVKEIIAKVEESYNTSLKVLDDTLMVKVRFIQSLKW